MSQKNHHFERPKIILSQCIELVACRHDGQRIADSFVRRLLDYVDVIPICPEVAIGMGVPRDPIRLVSGENGHTRLLQPSTGRDYTVAMEEYGVSILGQIADIDAIVLKSGSPSCGLQDVKVYGGLARAPMVRREPGMFARHLTPLNDRLVIEDEGRLRNFDLRHAFLTRIFAFADIRRLESNSSAGQLVDFQRRYKHLLYVYDEVGLRELGRIVANPDRLPAHENIRRYATRFRQALLKSPGRSTHFNALMHLYGHFKNHITPSEKDEFFQLLEEARHHQLPLSAIKAVLRSWSARFENTYLQDQVYLAPYPSALIQMRDSGKGLDF